jgi:hypothetical protein
MGKSKEAQFDIKFMGVDADIEARSSYERKLEYPVSIDESRYELRRRQTLIPLRVFCVEDATPTTLSQVSTKLASSP